MEKCWVFGVVGDSVNEYIKEVFSVVGIRSVFGVELDIEVGFVDVYDIFVVVIVGIDEKFFLVSW